MSDLVRITDADELQECLDEMMATAHGNPDWADKADTALIVILKYLISLDNEQRFMDSLSEKSAP